mgnify:CR=1 FL=1
MKSSAEARLAAEIEEKKPENILKKQLAERKLNAPPIYIPLDEIVVNLPGRGGEHYLQTKIVLRTADSKTEGKLFFAASHLSNLAHVLSPSFLVC